MTNLQAIYKAVNKPDALKLFNLLKDYAAYIDKWVYPGYMVTFEEINRWLDQEVKDDAEKVSEEVH